MPTDEKRQQVAEIKERFATAGGAILADYRGLTVKEMRALRKALQESGAQASVYKNSLAQIAIREAGLPSLDDFLVGPTIFVFTSEDPVPTAKSLVAFAKEHKELTLKGGFIDGQIIDAETIKVLSSLPSREELVSKLMGTLLNPVRGFMAMANAPAGALARAIRAVADQKMAA